MELPKLLNLLHSSGTIHSQSRPPFHILNPRALMHSLWASIRCPHCSSPFSIMHASRAFLVSGQAQQGFSVYKVLSHTLFHLILQQAEKTVGKKNDFFFRFTMSIFRPMGTHHRNISEQDSNAHKPQYHFGRLTV